MVNTRVTLVGAKELRAAIKRNPKAIADETNKFLVRSMSKYRKGIMSKPWQVGGTGGGAPVDTTALVASHHPVVNRWSARIGPDTKNIKYAWRIHEGFKGADSKGRKYNQEARPWLDYVKERNERAVQNLYRELHRNIVKDLAR